MMCTKSPIIGSLFPSPAKKKKEKKKKKKKKKKAREIAGAEMFCRMQSLSGLCDDVYVPMLLFDITSKALSFLLVPGLNFIKVIIRLEGDKPIIQSEALYCQISAALVFL